MEQAVGHLESLFQKAEADLSYISRKLDTEFAANYAHSGTEKLNPRRAIQRIERLREQIAAMQTASDELLAKKKDIAAKMNATLQSTRDTLEYVEKRAGVQNDDLRADELLKTAVGAVGIETHKDGNYSATYSSTTSSNNNNNKNSSSSGGGKGGGGGGNRSVIIEPAGELVMDHPEPTFVGGAVRRSKSVFTSVTQSEFDSVSDLVRGRAKVEDINTVYKGIHEFFKNNRNSDPLCTRDLVTMGLKVTGATGQASLKVLRALKLVSLNHAGDVKIL